MQRYSQSFILCFFFLASSLTSPLGALANDGIEQAGDLVSILLAATAIGVTVINHDVEGFFQYGKSATVSTCATYALNYTIKEESPNGDDRSFPSMHTSFSFTAAEFMRMRYGLEYGLPGYAAASFVGYSRVESDHHYWHDVLAGAVIGIASSYFFTETYHGVKISANADKNYVGAQLRYSW